MAKTMEALPPSAARPKPEQRLAAMYAEVDRMSNEFAEDAGLNKRAAQFGKKIIDILQQLCDRSIDQDDLKAEGAIAMNAKKTRTLAKLYVPWARIVECNDADDVPVRVEIDDSAEVIGDVRAAIDSVNKDIKSKAIEFVDTEGCTHRISRPIESQAIDALGNTIEGRAHGNVIVLRDLTSVLESTRPDAKSSSFKNSEH